jgi:hypothetical protein
MGALFYIQDQTGTKTNDTCTFRISHAFVNDSIGAFFAQIFPETMGVPVTLRIVKSAEGFVFTRQGVEFGVKIGDILSHDHGSVGHSDFGKFLSSMMEDFGMGDPETGWPHTRPPLNHL